MRLNRINKNTKKTGSENLIIKRTAKYATYSIKGNSRFYSDQDLISGIQKNMIAELNNGIIKRIEPQENSAVEISDKEHEKLLALKACKRYGPKIPFLKKIYFYGKRKELSQKQISTAIGVAKKVEEQEVLLGCCPDPIFKENKLILSDVKKEGKLKFEWDDDEELNNIQDDRK